MRPRHAAAARRRARAYFCGLPPPPLSSGSGGEERSHMTRRRRRLAQRHSAVSAERTRMRQWPAASSARSVQRPFVTQRGSGGTGWWHQPASGGALPSADAWPDIDGRREEHAHGSPPPPLGSRRVGTAVAEAEASARASERASEHVGARGSSGPASELASERAGGLACERASV